MMRCAGCGHEKPSSLFRTYSGFRGQVLVSVNCVACEDAIKAKYEHIKTKTKDAQSASGSVPIAAAA